jgi:hypothetical protein
MTSQKNLILMNLSSHLLEKLFADSAETCDHTISISFTKTFTMFVTTVLEAEEVR